jgi:hypothetical protein
MIRNNLKQVDLSREGLEARTHHHHRLNLYTSGASSRRFILLLEGQAVVEFESGMKFNIGSWEAFGTSILNAIEANTGLTNFKGSTRSLFTTNCPVQTLQFVPDFTLSVATNCKYLQITAGAYLAAIRVSNIVR